MTIAYAKRNNTSSPGNTLGDSITIEPSPYLKRHRTISRLFTFVLWLVSVPLVGILVLLVRLTSRGPGLYRQVRVGKGGKIFVMYKIRSMVDGAEDETGPAWAQGAADPRITPVGRFLRNSHLDELPQLWNVVRGEMALFGPRPERPELIHLLADEVPGYLNRLAVLPGITGLAQINLPPDSDYDSVRSKLKLDLEYIGAASPWLELRMFCWTCLRLVGVPAEVATRTMRVGRSAARSPLEYNGHGPITIETLVAGRRKQEEDGLQQEVDSLAIATVFNRTTA